MLETTEQRGLPQRNKRLAETLESSPFAKSTTIASEARLNEEFWHWFTDRSLRNSCIVEEIPLSDLQGWDFDEGTGNLVHDSGRFFSVEGLHVRADTSSVSEWAQPIIHQPEIGVLGILLRQIDGVPHCLMQAKVEPGNPGGVQLSPTVQATRSNYTQVHQGRAIRYLEHFRSPEHGRVLVDVLQSEQGSWFFHKRNRNIVVETDEDVEVADDFRWIPLRDLRALLGFDNLVNMDARTVLSCLPVSVNGDTHSIQFTGDEFGAALARSVASENEALHSTVDVLSWFTEAKTRHELIARRIPLLDVPYWRLSDRGLTHFDEKHFRILGAAVSATHREVANWTQPLLAPCGQGIVAFLSKRIHGMPHFLVQARAQHGHLDTVEIGPTVQCIPSTYQDCPPEHRPPYLDYLLYELPPEQIRYDRIQSEEGGRFYLAENRYVVAEIDDGLPTEESDRFRWMTLPQLVALLRHSHYLNVEARSLVTCLHSLW